MRPSRQYNHTLPLPKILPYIQWHMELGLTQNSRLWLPVSIPEVHSCNRRLLRVQKGRLDCLCTTLSKKWSWSRPVLAKVKTLLAKLFGISNTRCSQSWSARLCWWRLTTPTTDHPESASAIIVITMISVNRHHVGFSVFVSRALQSVGQRPRNKPTKSIPNSYRC